MAGGALRFDGDFVVAAPEQHCVGVQAEFEAAENSILFADDCRDLDSGNCTRIARLTGNLNRILVNEGEISPHIKNAVISIEDRRFYSHEGVDYTGIARALCTEDADRGPDPPAQPATGTCRGTRLGEAAR